MKDKPASLDLIAVANNKPTADELRRRIQMPHRVAAEEIYNRAGVRVTKRQVKRLARMMARQQGDTA